METVITKYHRWANGRTELYQLASRIEQLEEQIDNLDVEHNPNRQRQVLKLMNTVE